MRLAAPLLAGLALALGSSAAPGQEVGGSVVKRGALAEDLYLAGGLVEVEAEVGGDVVAAGGSVAIRGTVRGDILAAGGDLTVTGEALDDVRVAGGLVTLDGPIAGDAIAAGGRVRLGRLAGVGGRAWLAGGHVEVDGRVGRNLRVAARTIRIAGDVQGDVKVAGDTLEVLPTARIGGTLTYWSPRPARIAPQAKIGGEVIHHPSAMPDQVGAAARAVARTAALVLFASLIVSGLALLGVFPRFTLAAARTIRSDPWSCLGVGLALLLVTPISAVVVMVTGVGLSLGLAALALYVVALLAGFLTGAVFLGDLGLRLIGRERSLGWQALALVVALVALALARGIAVAGPLLLLVALLFGVGALGVRGYRVWAGAGS